MLMSRVRATAVAILGGVVLLTAGSSAAEASPQATCVAGDFCVFTSTYYSTGTPWVSFQAADDSWVLHFRAINNADKSWRNYWTKPVWVYEGDGYSGNQSACLLKGTSVAQYIPAQNRGSSHKWPGTVGCN